LQLKLGSLRGDVTDRDAQVPEFASISYSGAGLLRYLAEDERALVERTAEISAEFNSTLETLVLQVRFSFAISRLFELSGHCLFVMQSDDLLLRTRQMSQFSANMEDYFTRAARALRREEIGEGFSLTIGGKH